MDMAARDKRQETDILVYSVKREWGLAEKRNYSLKRMRYSSARVLFTSTPSRARKPKAFVGIYLHYFKRVNILSE
jgi:hypothetical protein